LEDFSFSNVHELELIENTRDILSKKLTSEISNEERYIIFQRIKFITKYLKIILAKAVSSELRKRIKRAIERYDKLIKKIMENKWFAYTLDSKIKLTRKNNDEPMLYIKGESKKQWIILLLLTCAIKNIIALPRHISKGSYLLIKNINQWLSRGCRKYKLKKRFNYINNLMSKTFVK
jgi:hypothetical protein